MNSDEVRDTCFLSRCVVEEPFCGAFCIFQCGTLVLISGTYCESTRGGIGNPESARTRCRHGRDVCECESHDVFAFCRREQDRLNNLYLSGYTHSLVCATYYL